MRFVVALAALALALAACGGSEGEPLPSSASELTVASPPAASDPAGEPETDESPEPAVAEREPENDGAAAEDGGVTLWVSRGDGTELIMEQRVDSGGTIIQALDRAADIETRYGGRFVTEIEGIGDSSGEQEDWFFLVNGIEPDVGAAEVKTGDGDVVWWDYRSWIDGGAHPAAVVGAFPYPFHRGWKGAVRPVEVTAPAELGESATALENFLGATPPDDPEAEPHRFVLELDPGGVGARLSASMGSKNGSPVTFVLSGTENAVVAAVAALIETPTMLERRYTAAFDEQGRVVEE